MKMIRTSLKLFRTVVCLLLWVAAFAVIGVLMIVMRGTFLNHHPQVCPNGSELTPRVLEYSILGAKVAFPWGYSCSATNGTKR